MKKIALSSFIIISFFILSACSYGKNTLYGEWKCISPDYSYYALSIDKKDAYFSMYDIEAGNPGISGHIKKMTDNYILCDFNQDDFDPPKQWKKLSKKDKIKYQIINKHKIKIGYNQYWLTFSRK